MIIDFLDQYARRMAYSLILFFYLSGFSITSIADVADGLIAHWPLDGDVKDSVGKHHGQLMGGAKFMKDEVRGTVLQLDGIDGHAVVSDAKALGFDKNESYTISLWVKVDQLPNHWVSIVNNWPHWPWYGLWVNEQNQWVASTINFAGSQIQAEKVWHHVAIVQNGQTEKRTLHINGHQDAEGIAWSSKGGSDLWIGGAKGMDNQFLEGWVDDVRIYNRPLAMYEIQGLSGREAGFAQDSSIKVTSRPEQQKQWLHFTASEGLAENEVKQMLVDQEGDFWFATPSGLTHFDGLFTTYLKDKPIEVLLEDESGPLWVGTKRNGLHHYQKKSQRWSTHLAGAWVLSLEQETNGLLWVGTTKGLYRYDGNKWQQPLQTATIYTLTKDLNNRLWVGSSRGLYSFEQGQRTHHLERIVIRTLLTSQNGVIWAGTDDHGIYTYDGLQWRQYLDGTTIRRLITTADGQIWAGTLAEGVYQYNGQIWKQHLGGKTIWNLLQGPDGTVWATSLGDSLYSFDGDTWKQHLEGKTVWSLIQGSDGILWAGTRRDGLYSYAGGQTYTDLNGQKVRGLLETRSGDVWAMADDGLYRLDETRWKQHLKGTVVRSLIEGSDGKIWAGTKGQGIYSFDGQAWTISLDKIWAECLLESSDGQIWAGTFGDGIFQFDGQKWTQFLEELGESALSVKRSIQTSDGRLWFGTEGWGLYNFDGLQWSHVNQIATDFGSLTIQGLHQDKQGKIWVVSRDEGLLSSMDGFIWTTELGGEGDKKVLDFLEGSDGAVWAATNEGVHLMGEEVPYLSGRSAGEFLETSNNAVWVATDQGIAKLRAGVGRLHFDFSPAAGLEIFDMLQRRNDQRRNNEILLATTDGVFTYIPDFSSPTLKITLINGKPFEPQTEIRIGEPSILLKWEGGDVRTETANLYYQYRVDNTVWSIPSRYTFQTLRNLVDGPQTIYLRAIDDDFNLSQPAALPLTVDTAQPSVLIAKPVPNQIVGGSVEIHGSILDSDLLAFKVEYRSAGTDVFQLIASGNQSQVSSTWPAKWKTRDLPDGSYQIRVIATDQLGHSKEHQVDIALDNTPPVVSLQTPQANQKLSGGLKITAQANDLHLHQYQLKYTQDLPLTAKSEWESIQTSAETLSASPAQIDDTWNSVAVFGSTLIRLLVQDQAGNQQTADVIVDLANQTAKPGVRITQPQVQQVIKEILSIVGTVEEYGYSIIDNYQLSFGLGQNPSQWTSIHRGSNAVNDNVLGSWDTRQQKDGLCTLRLLAINGRGYQNSQQITVTLDNTPPTALISRPDQNKEWIAGQQVEIRGTASDDNFQQYRLEYEERSNPASWSIIGATSSQAVEKDILQLWRTGGLDDGQYQLRLTVTDQAGNQTQTIQTLTLDNQKPEVKLTAPAEKAVVSGVIQITGVIKDDNLKDYQLEVQLVSRPTGWERIGAGGTEAGQEQLGQWNTRQIKDGSYRLRLTATDQTGQSSQLTRLVTVDNTPPQAEIATPRNNDQVGQVVVLFGTASDASFKFYQVEFGEGISPTVWTPIATRKTEVKTDELLQWLSGKRTGFYSLRLTVEDMVKHQSRSQVTVLIKSPTEKARGGDFGSADGGVTLYLPPNSLQKDTIVTVNRIPSSAIAWPQGSSWQPLDLVYQLEADPLQLNRIKPATLTISYGGASLTPGQQPTIFRQVDNTEQWQLIGGMVNASQQTVRTAVHQLGRYGVMEMALVQADSSAQLVKDSLTCQPRVFSPIGRRAPNTETTISFQLDKAAKVSIKVYNVAGGLVNWLAEEQTFSEGKVALPWDGRDHQGQVVATGLYIVVVTVGSETQTKVVNVWNQ